MKPAWWVAQVAADTSLSSDARLLLLFIGTRAKGWRYSVEACVRAMLWGDQKFKKIMREVKAAGWISTAYRRRRNGQIDHVSVVVRLQPVPGSQKGENHPSGKAGQKGDFKPCGQKGENHPGISIRETPLPSGTGATVLAFTGRARNA